MSDKRKPYKPHQSWAGQGPKTFLPTQGDAGWGPKGLTKSAWDAERRASGQMGKGEAARYDHSIKIANIMKEGEASRQKSLLTSQQSTVRQEKAAGKLGTKLRHLITNLKGRPRGR